VHDVLLGNDVGVSKMGKVGSVSNRAVSSFLMKMSKFVEKQRRRIICFSQEGWCRIKRKGDCITL
jgi:hypothetical protein